MMKTYNVFKTFDSKASPPKSPTADTSQVQLEAVSGGANEMPQGEMNETMAMSGFFQSMGKSFRQSFDAGVQVNRHRSLYAQQQHNKEQQHNTSAFTSVHPFIS